jgi:hypothetical protein
LEQLGAGQKLDLDEGTAVPSSGELEVNRASAGVCLPRHVDVRELAQRGPHCGGRSVNDQLVARLRELVIPQDPPKVAVFHGALEAVYQGADP